MSLKRMLFFFLLLCFLSTAVPAFCEEEAGIINPKNLLSRADADIFVRSAFIQDFSEDQGYVNELPNPTTIHQYFIYEGVGTDRLLSLLPAAEDVRTTNKRLTFSQTRKDEFHVTYSVIQKENIPETGNGRCWIRYSNIGIIPEGKESGLIFFPGEKAYFFYPSENKMVYEEIADLSALDPMTENKFDFIRMEQTVYVYANGKFLFDYKDGIPEWVSFEAGAELFKGANQVRCDFDNYTMRIK